MARVVSAASLLVMAAGCAATEPKSVVVEPKPAASEAKATFPAPAERAALSGQLQRLDNFYSINPDCASRGEVQVRFVTAPSHGTLTLKNGADYPSFNRDNSRYECGKQEVPVVALYYQSEAGFSGADGAMIDVLYPDGNLRHITYSLNVWPSASPAAPRSSQ